MEGWGGLTHQLAQDYGQGQDVMQSPSGPPLLSHYSAPLRPRDSLSAHRDALSQLARLSLGSRQGFSPGTGFEDATHSPQDGVTSAPSAPVDTFPFKKTRRGKRAGRNLKLRNAESEIRRKSADMDSPIGWQARCQDPTGPLTPRASLSTPRTAPVTPMTAPSPLGLRMGTASAPHMSPGTPSPAAGSTVWAPARSHVQTASPWDSPQPMALSPYALDHHTLDFLTPLNSLDSAHDGRADAAWGEQLLPHQDISRAAMGQLPDELSRAAIGKLRPTGSAPNSLSRRLHFAEEPLSWPPPRHSIATQPQLGLLPRIESTRSLIPAGPDTCSPLARVPTWEGIADHLADGACHMPFLGPPRCS